MHREGAIDSIRLKRRVPYFAAATTNSADRSGSVSAVSNWPLLKSATPATVASG
jgi:hypothetical protein